MTSIINSESIQDLIERDPPKPVKMKRHVSAFREKAKNDTIRVKKSKSTLGNPEEPLPGPDEYLKKNTRAEIKKETDEPRCLHEERRPRLPSANGMIKREQKDFLSENKRSISSAKLKYEQPKVIDSRKGKSWPVQRPFYVFKKNYGSAPAFKQPFKVDGATPENKDQQEMHLMTNDEKMEIKEGLQRNLREKNEKFLLLPVIIDTPYLINRKKRLESEIKQLEADLDLITSNFEIYITDN